MTMTEPELKEGRVVGIAGPVIDVEFPRGALPELNSAIEFDIVMGGESTTVLAEVAQQLGEGRVRAICMRPTDGLVRGAAVRNTGRGITVPVGDKVLGHVWNVWGQPLDEEPEGFAEMERWEIHRDAPGFDALVFTFQSSLKSRASRPKPSCPACRSASPVSIQCLSCR